MKPFWLLVSIAGAGGLLCLAAWLFDSPASSAGPNAGRSSSEASDTQLADLRSTLDELALRIERLELEDAARAAPIIAPVLERVSAPALTPVLTNEELDALRALAAALGPARVDGGAPLEELVAEVIEERESRERAERSEERRAAALERVEGRVAELSLQLGLSSFQSGEMLSLLTAEELGREAFFDELRETSAFDRDLVRARMKDLRDATLAGARNVLASDQYDRYVASRPDDFLAGIGRAPRPDGGSPGR